MASHSPPVPVAARRRRSDGERSRAAILGEAARMATVDGLDGLSLSRLADAVGLSKSGLFAHFGSKQELQLATIEHAGIVFGEIVIVPAERAPAGVARLRAYTEAFVDHVADGVFPGGCFFVSAIGEVGPQTGPVHDRALAFSRQWMELLAEQIAVAQRSGELAGGSDPAQVAFELNAFMVLGSLQFVASGDAGVLDRVRAAIETRLAALEAR